MRVLTLVAAAFIIAGTLAWIFTTPPAENEQLAPPPTFAEAAAALPTQPTSRVGTDRDDDRIREEMQALEQEVRGSLAAPDISDPVRDLEERLATQRFLLCMAQTDEDWEYCRTMQASRQGQPRADAVAAYPDLWSALDPGQIGASTGQPLSGISSVPAPRELMIDTTLFEFSSAEDRERLEQAVAAYLGGLPAESLRTLEPADPDDPNVQLVAGLASLALPGGGNLDRGVALLDRAAAGGQRQAMVYRGLLLLAGAAPVARDPVRGLDLLRRAADLGDIVAARQVGASYHFGWAGTADDDLAARYMRMAADGGDLEAEVALASFALNGTGMEADEAEAMRRLHRAGERGHPEAQAVLGAFYMQQFTRDELPDPSEAIRWLSLAAEQDEVKSMHLLGIILIELGRTEPWIDYPRAVDLFRRCGQQWYGPCLFGYAAAPEQGRGMSADPVRAYAFYAQSSDLGQTKAPDRLAALESRLTPSQLERARALAAHLAERYRAGQPPLEHPVHLAPDAQFMVNVFGGATIHAIRPGPDKGEGALVGGLHPSSDAGQLGLKMGDIIVAVDDRAITSLHDLADSLAILGGPSTVTVHRDGETVTLALR